MAYIARIKEDEICFTYFIKKRKEVEIYEKREKTYCITNGTCFSNGSHDSMWI